VDPGTEGGRERDAGTPHTHHKTRASRRSLMTMFAKTEKGSDFKNKIMERYAREGDERNMHGRDKEHIGDGMIKPINKWRWEESDETDDEAVQAGAKGD